MGAATQEIAVAATQAGGPEAAAAAQAAKAEAAAATHAAKDEAAAAAHQSCIWGWSSSIGGS